MSLNITLTPGAVVASTDLVTPELLNLIANPTIALEGSVGSLFLADGSVTTPKLANGALSADATGRAKMADSFITLVKILDGIFTADATGRAKVADLFVNAAKLAADAVTTVKILDANVTAAKLDNSARLDVHQYAVGTLGGSIYAVPLSPAATAYVTGMVVTFSASGTNPGPMFINVNGLGNKVLRKPSANLLAGDIVSGQLVTAIYNGTDFQVMTLLPSYFSSAEQVINVGAGPWASVAHGLNGVPRFVRWVLVNKITEGGYAVGDEIDCSSVRDNGTGWSAFSYGAEAANVFLIAESAAIKIRHKTTGANVNGLTTANWRVKAYCEL